jgi:hypothetical protein
MSEIPYQTPNTKLNYPLFTPYNPNDEYSTSIYIQDEEQLATLKSIFEDRERKEREEKEKQSNELAETENVKIKVVVRDIVDVFLKDLLAKANQDQEEKIKKALEESTNNDSSDNNDKDGRQGVRKKKNTKQYDEECCAKAEHLYELLVNNETMHTKFNCEHYGYDELYLKAIWNHVRRYKYAGAGSLMSVLNSISEFRRIEQELMVRLSVDDSENVTDDFYILTSYVKN